MYGVGNWCCGWFGYCGGLILRVCCLLVVVAVVLDLAILFVACR